MAVFWPVDLRKESNRMAWSCDKVEAATFRGGMSGKHLTSGGCARIQNSREQITGGERAYWRFMDAEQDWRFMDDLPRRSRLSCALPLQNCQSL